MPRYIRGGEKMVMVLAEMNAKLKGAHLVRVGFLGNATYPGGTNVATVAAIQEFGAPAAGIPPRPYFRNMIARRKSEWPKILAQAIKQNDYAAEPALATLGEAVVGQLKQSILETNDPPLKPATVKRKGFSKPLIASSNLINSVDREVE